MLKLTIKTTIIIISLLSSSAVMAKILATTEPFSFGDYFCLIFGAISITMSMHLFFDLDK